MDHGSDDRLYQLMDNVLASGTADASLLSVLTKRRTSQLTSNRQNLAAKRQRISNRGSTHFWQPEQVIDLLHFLEEAKHEGHQLENGTFTIFNYRDAAHALSEKYDIEMTDERVKNKFNYLKSQWDDWQRHLAHLDDEWVESPRSAPHADSDVVEAHYKDNPPCRPFRRQYLRFWENLEPILGDREVPPPPVPVIRHRYPNATDLGLEPEIEAEGGHARQDDAVHPTVEVDVSESALTNMPDYRALQEVVAEQGRAINQLTEVMREVARVQRLAQIPMVPPFVRVMERFKMIPRFRALEWRARKVVIGVVRDDADVLDTLDDPGLQSWLEEILRDHRIALPRTIVR